MSDPERPAQALPDTQQQRWLKYGANVAVTIVLVIAIVAIAITAAQWKDRRLDTTSSGEFSLHPQTLNVIRDLTQRIKLVSLYTRSSNAAKQEEQADFAGAVADLLEEYKRSGKNIDVEFVDPQAQPAKSNDLLAEVTAKYGGEVARYQAFVDERKAAFADFKAFAAAEVAKLPPFDALKQGGVDEKLQLVSNTLANTPTDVDTAEREISRATSTKVPDYKVAAAAFDREARGVADDADGIGEFLRQLAAVDGPSVTPAMKQYAAAAAPRFAAVKAKADAVDAEFKKLGDLKLDDVKQKVRESDAILVLGPTDMRTLSFGQVWQADTDKKQLAAAAKAGGDALAKPKFLGEQQVTGAILAVTAAHKPKAVFVRPGGGPLTSPGFPPFQPAGPFSRFADRLRLYNFDVLEKDASGEYAMRAQMQGGPTAPEPTDDEIKDAIWIVLDFPTQQRQQMPGMPPPASPADPVLAKHLAEGGSAVVVMMTGADKMAASLGPWGVDARTDLVAVHDLVKTDATAAAAASGINEALKLPIYWSVDAYGDSPVTAPLRSLDTILVDCAPIVRQPRQGYTAGPLLPFPQALRSWGAHDVEAAAGGDPVKFDAAGGDLAAPIFGGATVQSPAGGRLVVLGSLPMATNQAFEIRDPDVRQAARFPGNAEVLCNSVFWAGHMDQLIAISPAAMDVSRIGSMSDGALRFWRVGLLLIGLPGLVVAAGVAVYLVRRS